MEIDYCYAKQPHHTHLWQLSSLSPNQTRGLLQLLREVPTARGRGGEEREK